MRFHGRGRSSGMQIEAKVATHRPIRTVMLHPTPVAQCQSLTSDIATCTPIQN